MEHQAINAHTITDHISSPVERHSRHPPVWIRDYDNREGFFNEDHQDNFALFVDANLSSYKDAAQSSK